MSTTERSRLSPVMFQFHIGAIRMELNRQIRSNLNKFQFPIGAIRIQLFCTPSRSCQGFQFHIGAIRIGDDLHKLEDLQSFNSILVQLESWTDASIAVPAALFQFHIGAIRIRLV